MNRFQVRNLMIQALSDEGQIGIGLAAGCGNIFTCPAITCCAATLAAPHSWGFAAGQDLSSPDDLSVLKRQLRLALARIEQQEQALEEQLKPQSLEEVELLEARHNKALEKLRARRDELKEESDT